MEHVTLHMSLIIPVILQLFANVFKTQKRNDDGRRVDNYVNDMSRFVDNYLIGMDIGALAVAV